METQLVSERVTHYTSSHSEHYELCYLETLVVGAHLQRANEDNSTHHDDCPQQYIMLVKK